MPQLPFFAHAKIFPVSLSLPLPLLLFFRAVSANGVLCNRLQIASVCACLLLLEPIKRVVNVGSSPKDFIAQLKKTTPPISSLPFILFLSCSLSLIVAVCRALL